MTKYQVAASRSEKLGQYVSAKKVPQMATWGRLQKCVNQHRPYAKKPIIFFFLQSMLNACKTNGKCFIAN